MEGSLLKEAGPAEWFAGLSPESQYALAGSLIGGGTMGGLNMLRQGRKNRFRNFLSGAAAGGLGGAALGYGAGSLSSRTPPAVGGPGASASGPAAAGVSKPGGDGGEGRGPGEGDGDTPVASSKAAPPPQVATPAKPAGPAATLFGAQGRAKGPGNAPPPAIPEVKPPPKTLPQVNEVPADEQAFDAAVGAAGEVPGIVGSTAIGGAVGAGKGAIIGTGVGAGVGGVKGFLAQQAANKGITAANNALPAANAAAAAQASQANHAAIKAYRDAVRARLNTAATSLDAPAFRVQGDQQKATARLQDLYKEYLGLNAAKQPIPQGLYDEMTHLDNQLGRMSVHQRALGQKVVNGLPPAPTPPALSSPMPVKPAPLGDPQAAAMAGMRKGVTGKIPGLDRAGALGRLASGARAPGLGATLGGLIGGARGLHSSITEEK